MADQTFAERLRERAEDCRHPIGPGVRLGVPLDPDEADAVADLVEVAQRVEEFGWSEDAPAACVTAHLDLLAALTRVAVKSAEGQPGS